MNELFIRCLSLSLSGLILALVLLALKPLLRDRTSKAWQYYIWLIVIIRLLVPYSPSILNIEQLYQHVDIPSSIQEETSRYQYSPIVNDILHPSQFVQEIDSAIPTREETLYSLKWIIDYVWVLWITVAFGLFVYKVINYNRYTRYIKKNKFAVIDRDIQIIYKKVCTEVGIKNPLSINIHNMIESPALIGFINPIIVLPNYEINDVELYNVFIHELTHYKRMDNIYKWVIQITACLHWFNPIVYFITKEINRNCELACDEVIIKKMNTEGKRQYGNTLLSYVKISRNHAGTGVSLSLNEDAKILKERLGFIMKFRNKTITTTVLTIALTFTLIFCSTLIGAYAMQEIPSDTINSSLLPQKLNQSQNAVTDVKTESSVKTHPGNKQFIAIDSTKVTTIKFNINTASVNLKTTDNDKFRLSYTGKANTSYKASVKITGSKKEIATINITGKTQEITQKITEDLTEIDSVTLEIPNKAYENISIKSSNGVLRICEMNASIFVDDTKGIITLNDSELTRGSYSLKTNSGIINVEMKSLLTQMNTENNNGIVNIKFNKEPALGKFFLNIKGGKNSITLPKDWDKFISKKDSDLKNNPSLYINNNSGFTKVIVKDKSEDVVDMNTATILNERYYLIESEEDLRAIGSGPYALSDNYMLNKDITLTKEWKAIGDENAPFTGKFEGNGCTISNLTIKDKEAKYIGLFGMVKGAKIHNVTLFNVNIANAGSKGGSTSPFVAIALDSEVSDCQVK